MRIYKINLASCWSSTQTKVGDDDDKNGSTTLPLSPLVFESLFVDREINKIPLDTTQVLFLQGTSETNNIDENDKNNSNVVNNEMLHYCLQQLFKLRLPQIKQLHLCNHLQINVETISILSNLVDYFNKTSNNIFRMVYFDTTPLSTPVMEHLSQMIFKINKYTIQYNKQKTGNDPKIYPFRILFKDCIWIQLENNNDKETSSKVSSSLSTTTTTNDTKMSLSTTYFPNYLSIKVTNKNKGISTITLQQAKFVLKRCFTLKVKSQIFQFHKLSITFDALQYLLSKCNYQYLTPKRRQQQQQQNEQFLTREMQFVACKILQCEKEKTSNNNNNNNLKQLIDGLLFTLDKENCEFSNFEAMEKNKHGCQLLSQIIQQAIETNLFHCLHFTKIKTCKNNLHFLLSPVNNVIGDDTTNDDDNNNNKTLSRLRKVEFQDAIIENNNNNNDLQTLSWYKAHFRQMTWTIQDKQIEFHPDSIRSRNGPCIKAIMEFLSTDSCCWSSSSAAAAVALPLVSIQRLVFKCYVIDLHDDVIGSNLHKTNVQELDLSQCFHWNSTFENFVESMSFNTKLKRLNLSFKRFGHYNHVALCTLLPKVPNIQDIMMEYTNLTNEHVQSMALAFQSTRSSSTTTTLKDKLPLSIELSGNKDISMPSIIDLIQASQLQKIRLNRCELSNQDAQQLAMALKDNTTITRVQLKGNFKINWNICLGYFLKVIRHYNTTLKYFEFDFIKIVPRGGGGLSTQLVQGKKEFDFWLKLNCLGRKSLLLEEVQDLPLFLLKFLFIQKASVMDPSCLFWLLQTFPHYWLSIF